MMQNTLSLHHAVVGTSLLSLTMMPLAVLNFGRVRSPGVFLAQQIRRGLYGGAQLWITWTMPCFGTEPQCNLCMRSSFMGYSFRIVLATNRSVRLAIQLFLLIIWLRDQAWEYGPVHYLQAFPALLSERRKGDWNSYIDDHIMANADWRRKVVEEHRRRWIRDKGKKVDPWYFKLYNHYMFWLNEGTTAKAKIENEVRKRQALHRSSTTWAGRVWTDATHAIRTARCQRAIVALVITVIYVCDIEKEVQLNLTGSSNSWGYGQIFALLAAIPSVSAATKLFLNLGRRHEYPLPSLQSLGFDESKHETLIKAPPSRTATW